MAVEALSEHLSHARCSVCSIASYVPIWELIYTKCKWSCQRPRKCFGGLRVVSANTGHSTARLLPKPLRAALNVTRRPVRAQRIKRMHPSHNLDDARGHVQHLADDATIRRQENAREACFESSTHKRLIVGRRLGPSLGLATLTILIGVTVISMLGSSVNNRETGCPLNLRECFAFADFLQPCLGWVRHPCWNKGALLYSCSRRP